MGKASYDLSTDSGRVRLLIKDTDTTNAIFDDAEIGVFLEMEDQSVKLAAALALETIASDEALVQKVTSIAGVVSTNGAATAKAILDRAKMLREQASAGLGDGEGLFETAEMPTTVFAGRERIWKEWERGLL